uniref:Uncharacterized protein n=1 Tax=Meloidogyne enterolobii TaxID=390850 RepID=A0A6V7WK62_MELEN|nr:unnamed protein product [Meloidogyne enterolobii]
MSAKRMRIFVPKVPKPTIHKRKMGATPCRKNARKGRKNAHSLCGHVGYQPDIYQFQQLNQLLCQQMEGCMF